MSAPPRGQSDGASVTAPDQPLTSQFAADPEMAELIELFVGEMPERVASVERLWNERSYEELRRTAHRLKGAGGGYGYPKVSEAAGMLEDALLRARKEPGVQMEELFNRVKREVDDLVAVCRRVRAR